MSPGESAADLGDEHTMRESRQQGIEPRQNFVHRRQRAVLFLHEGNFTIGERGRV
jgi:hypothetical protein